MIRNSFTILPKVGLAKERQIWAQGISDWSGFMKAQKIMGISKKSKSAYDRLLSKASDALCSGDTRYFFHLLPGSEMWRLYQEFRDEALFLDIEKSSVSGHITLIGLSDGEGYRGFTRGNFEEALRMIKNSKLIVTYNGSVYDIPSIKGLCSDLPAIPVFDLRWALARLGIIGGLKQIEELLLIDRRPLVKQLKGGDPYLLWKTYLSTGDTHYLELLSEYNEDDTANLRRIADYATERLAFKYNNLISDFPS